MHGTQLSDSSSRRDVDQRRYLTHFESAIDPSVRLPANEIQTMHENRPLWARYDLDRVKSLMTKERLSTRRQDMWRYRELLPVGDSISPVTMNKSMSPIIDCPRLASQFGLKNIWIKDESQLPTCSFKSRGLSMAVTMARHFGIKRIAMSSNGNAGGAMAMYAARGGLECVVFMPHDSTAVSLSECYYSGAKLFATNGLIDENGKRIREGHDLGLWFDISTMKEPYRLEGKKTMGLELAEQFDWELPDVILYPTGGGTALIGMYKAFEELREMGFLNSDKMPRMIACQTTGCMPICTAFHAGLRFAERHENAHTIASGLRVPVALGDFMVIDTVRKSGGTVLAADEDLLTQYQRQVASTEGLMICPEAATCIGGLEQMVDAKLINENDKVVIFNTAAGQKYFGREQLPLVQLDISKPIDWDAFQRDYLV